MTKEEAILKDRILAYANEAQEGHYSRTHFLNKTLKSEGVEIKIRALLRTVEEIAEDGYLKIAKDKDSTHFILTNRGFKFIEEKGYRSLFEQNESEQNKEAEREKKLDQLNNMNIKSLKWDLPIKIITGIVAVTGLIISLFALFRS